MGFQLAEVGSVIFEGIQAIDMDAGRNSQIEYSLIFDGDQSVSLAVCIHRTLVGFVGLFVGFPSGSSVGCLCFCFPLKPKM